MIKYATRLSTVSKRIIWNASDIFPFNSDKKDFPTRSVTPYSLCRVIARFNYCTRYRYISYFKLKTRDDMYGMYVDTVLYYGIISWFIFSLG
jgi:hypothetical protein